MVCGLSAANRHRYCLQDSLLLRLLPLLLLLRHLQTRLTKLLPAALPACDLPLPASDAAVLRGQRRQRSCFAAAAEVLYLLYLGEPGQVWLQVWAGTNRPLLLAADSFESYLDRLCGDTAFVDLQEVHWKLPVVHAAVASAAAVSR
jgi:hypothetical protein